MSTEIVTTQSQPISVAPVGDIECTATRPGEMAKAQGALIAWCERKIAQLRGEHKELQAAYEQAVEKKWKSSTLNRHAQLAARRVVYYEKIMAALEAGYCIVPNFPISLFAIRTDRDKPAECYRVELCYREPRGHLKTEPAKQLPPGEGKYQNPEVPQKWALDEVKKDQHGNDTSYYGLWSEEFDDIAFPLNMAKAQIMEATGEAMKLKLFDELGVLPDPRRKADPVIIGTLIDPRSTKWNKRVVSFILAWHLDTRTL